MNIPRTSLLLAMGSCLLGATVFGVAAFAWTGSATGSFTAQAGEWVTPPPPTPSGSLLACIKAGEGPDPKSGRYNVIFGYTDVTPSKMTVPAGSNNLLAWVGSGPGPKDDKPKAREDIKKGTHWNGFQSSFEPGGSVTWTLTIGPDTWSVTADASSPNCTPSNSHKNDAGFSALAGPTADESAADNGNDSPPEDDASPAADDGPTTGGDDSAGDASPTSGADTTPPDNDASTADGPATGPGEGAQGDDGSPTGDEDPTEDDGDRPAPPQKTGGPRTFGKTPAALIEP